MDLNEIKQVKGEFIQPQRKEKPAKKQVENQEKKPPLKEVPKSPDYWQSAIGIKKSKPSFKGDLNEGLTPEEFDKYYREISKYCFYREKDDRPISTYKEHLEKLIPLGKDKVSTYCELAGNSLDNISYPQKDNEPFYLETAFQLLKTLPDVDKEQYGKLDKIMFYLFRTSLSNEEIQNFVDISKAVIQAENGELSTKMAWLSHNVVDYSMKKDQDTIFLNPDEALQNYEQYNELLSFYPNEEDKEAILKMDFSNDDLSKLLSFAENEEFDKPKRLAFISRNSKQFYFHKISKEEVIAFLDEINSNEEKKTIFKKLLSPKLFAISLFSDTYDTLLNGDKEKLSILLDGLIEIADETQSAPIISDPRNFYDSYDLLSKDNIPDFLALVKENGFSSAAYEISEYKNPKTGVFDTKIKEASDKIAYHIDDNYESIDIARACVDMKTGEISPIAMEVIETLYPKIEYDTFKERLKVLPTVLKVKSKIAKPTVISCWNPDIVGFINSLKDKDGVFNEENKAFLYELLKTNKKKNSYSIIEMTTLAAIINNVKDENGIVDKSFASSAIKILKQTKRYENVSNVFEALAPFSFDKKKEILEKLLPISAGDKKNYVNFAPFVQFCFDENGNINENNFYIVSILIDLNSSEYNVNFLNLFNEYPESQPLLYQLAREIPSISQLMEIEKVFEQYTVDDDMKSKLAQFGQEIGTLQYFTNLYDSCLLKDKNNNVVGFDEELFEESINLIKLEREHSHIWAIDGSNAAQIIKEEFSFADFNFKQKVNLLNSTKYLRNEVIPKEELEKYSYLNKLISDVEASLTMNDIGLPIDEKSKISFLKNILTSSNVKGVYTPFEQTIVQGIPTLEQLTTGLPLSYSRQDFLKDLSKICDTEDKLNLLSKKTTINPIVDNSQKPLKITGYNGIIQLKDLDQNNPLEKQIYDCMHKFLYDNKIQTNDSSLNNYLNDIIGAFPEFINVIGKKQHGTHKYTVDVHSLLVLAYSIEHPNYLTKLNNLDKSLFKLVAVFHDLMKLEGEVDKTHQHSSSLYARSIIPKIIKNPETRDRIFELIDNHHWLEGYANSDNKNLTAQELAFRFRRPNDFEIAQIMADSDLKAVSPEFYESHISALNDDVINNIQSKLDYIYSTGNSILHSRIIAPSKLENYKQTYNGVDYPVINLHDIDENEDMGKYGFQGGIKKKDLQFLVHMVPREDMSDALDTVKLLSSPLNGGVLSESLITPKYKRTYSNRKYGVLLSQINTNIVNADSHNQGSGNQKDMQNVMSLIFNSSINCRTEFKHDFLGYLNLLPTSVSDSDFATFYRQNLANKTEILQFPKKKMFKIGAYSFSGEQIQNALSKYQESLVDKKELTHNEIVGYTPKIQAVIAKEKSLQDVPQELLDFAHKYNYPVILV